MPLEVYKNARSSHSRICKEKTYNLWIKCLKKGQIYERPHNNRFLINLKNYKGYLPDKYDGLWQYDYHFACENSFEKGYFTEKLIDPIITETLCFYDGCPNIQEYIDERAYVKIDVTNIQESISTIVQCIQDDEWRKDYFIF